MHGRAVPFLAVPLLALAGCSFSEPDGTAAATRDRVLAEADRTVPVVVEAVGGTDVEATAQWESCMGYDSWSYRGSAFVTVPATDGAAPGGEEQLDAVRTALAELGYDDTGAVEDKVTVEAEGYDLVVTWSGVREKWDLTFSSNSCLLFDDADNELVAQDGERELDLTP